MSDEENERRKGNDREIHLRVFFATCMGRWGFFRRKNLLVFAEKFKLGDASFKQLPRASPNLNFSANI